MVSNYEKIKSECRSQNILWEDPDFPAIQSSVFYYQTPPFTFQWKRISELSVAQAHFINETSNFDIHPGKMGDRWLVSCLGVLYSLRNLFFRVVPADQNLEKSNGIFRFRLWWCGEWTEVLIDDRLPTINGRLAFLQPHTSHCFWASLLEKAIAKLHGSYEALKYGTRSDGLSDLLGGVVESVPLTIAGNSNCAIRPQQLKTALDTTCIVTCIVTSQPSQHKTDVDELPNGILENVNYRLTAVDKVETQFGDFVQLVRLKDPFFNSSVKSEHIFNGDWSATSRSWERVSSKERDRLMDQLEVGEFWMSLMEFMQTFSNLEYVYLDADTAKDETSLHDKAIKWQMKMFQGQWKRGVTAGGCRNHESFHLNPQLLVIVNEKQDLVIALNQHTAVEPKVIGFSVYKVRSGSGGVNNTKTKLNECLSKEFFKNQVSFINSDYGNTRHVSYHCHFDVGHYVVIPTTYEPGEEASFTVRVFGTTSFRLSLLEIQTMILLEPFPSLKNNRDNTKLKNFCQYEPVFMQLADDNKLINCFDLHELLEACLPNDYIKGCANIGICRQVIALQDTTGIGRINFVQFKTFMINLKSWQGVFKIYSKEKAGILRAERLRDALYDVGFQLSNDVMNCLILRYIRKDGTLRLSDFVSIILHLAAVFNYFKKFGNNQENVIEISMSDWLKCVLRC